MILEIQKFIFALMLICSFQIVAFAQYDYEAASVLLAAKDAKLIVIGEVNGLMRSYSKPKEDQSKDDAAVRDFTNVNFRVLEVLKGKYSEKDISVLYEGHMGFAESSQWVLVLFDAPSNLMDKYDRTLFNSSMCKTQTCYVSSSKWLFPATKDELPIFRGFLSSLNTNDKPKKPKK